MSTYRVELDCWRRTKPRSRWAVRMTKAFIVEAEDSEAAFKIARQHVQLPCGHRWLAIEDRECMTLKLPICTMTLQHSPIKMNADFSGRAGG